MQTDTPSTNPLDYLDVARAILEAHAAGHPVKWELWDGEEWILAKNRACPLFTLSGDMMPIRIAPFKLGNEINGHTLPEGDRWSDAA